MVAVAQLVEPWIVIPVVVGSSPISHPNSHPNEINKLIQSPFGLSVVSTYLLSQQEKSMASFRKRSNGWQARIRRKGYPDITKTFSKRSEANAWARQVESDIDKGAFISRVEAENTTLSELLNRYLNEITPHKKHFKVEVCRIYAWLKNPLSQRYLSTLRTTDFASWRDDRVKQGKSSNTIKLELAIISHLYSVARAEWGFVSLENPIRYLRMPKLPNGRTRRVSDSEIQLLIEHSCSKELPNILKLGKPLVF